MRSLEENVQKLFNSYKYVYEKTLRVFIFIYLRMYAIVSKLLSTNIVRPD